MKKLLCAVLAVILVFSLTACGKGGADSDPGKKPEGSASPEASANPVVSASPEVAASPEVSASPSPKPSKTPATPESPGESPAANDADEGLAWWSGEWYGFWRLNYASELYMDLYGTSWDCYAIIDVGENGLATVYIWDDDVELGHVDLYIEPDAGGKMGSATSESGKLFDMPVVYADWQIRPYNADFYGMTYDHMIFIDAFHTDADFESFGYEIYLRPWGMLWDDVSEDDRPPYYESWYKDVCDEPFYDVFDELATRPGAYGEYLDKYLAYVTLSFPDPPDWSEFYIDEVLWVRYDDIELQQYYGLDEEDMEDGYAVVNEVVEPLPYSAYSDTVFMVMISDDGKSLTPNRSVSMEEFIKYLNKQYEQKVLAEVVFGNGRIRSIREKYTP